MSETRYEATIEYDPNFKPWPWFATVYLNGDQVGTLMSASTRKGAIRQARRVVKRHKAQYAKRVSSTEVIAL